MSATGRHLPTGGRQQTWTQITEVFQFIRLEQAMALGEVATSMGRLTRFAHHHGDTCVAETRTPISRRHSSARPDFLPHQTQTDARERPDD